MTRVSLHNTEERMQRTDSAAMLPRWVTQGITHFAGLSQSIASLSDFFSRVETSIKGLAGSNEPQSPEPDPAHSYPSSLLALNLPPTGPNHKRLLAPQYSSAAASNDSATHALPTLKRNRPNQLHSLSLHLYSSAPPPSQSLLLPSQEDGESQSSPADQISFEFSPSSVSSTPPPPSFQLPSLELAREDGQQLSLDSLLLCCNTCHAPLACARETHLQECTTKRYFGFVTYLL